MGVRMTVRIWRGFQGGADGDADRALAFWSFVRVHDGEVLY